MNPTTTIEEAYQYTCSKDGIEMQIVFDGTASQTIESICYGRLLDLKNAITWGDLPLLGGKVGVKTPITRIITNPPPGRVLLSHILPEQLHWSRYIEQKSTTIHERVVARLWQSSKLISEVRPSIQPNAVLTWLLLLRYAWTRLPICSWWWKAVNEYECNKDIAFFLCILGERNQWSDDCLTLYKTTRPHNYGNLIDATVPDLQRWVNNKIAIDTTETYSDAKCYRHISNFLLTMRNQENNKEQPLEKEVQPARYTMPEFVKLVNKLEATYVDSRS